MKNEMPDRIFVWFQSGQNHITKHESFRPQIPKTDYTRTDLTDRRADVDALIEILEDPTHDWNNVVEAITTIRSGREEK